MTKSLSMPCHVTAIPPDPFPELSRHKMRLYRFQNIESTEDQTSTSQSSEAGRTSPSTMLSTASDASGAETSSSADSVTMQVLLLFAVGMYVFSCK